MFLIDWPVKAFNLTLIRNPAFVPKQYLAEGVWRCARKIDRGTYLFSSRAL